jgi:tetratricopeptide (TPR) repeat protein
MSGSSQTQQLLNKATALYHSGDYRQAIQVWQELLSQDPQNQRALEGIRMASLLLEEAQTGEAAAPVVGESAASETPEVIAKVREGIQKVRSFLSAARYMDAMEVCQALLQLAPRSEAVREVLEEARDAYEAQPFIDEHLEIARQLFVQDRLDEATAEIQKIFFLSANHGEAKKLEAKIEALRQKRSPDTEPSAPTDSASSGTNTQQIQMPPDFGEGVDLPQESPEPAVSTEALGSETSPPEVPSSPKVEDQVLNEDWEAELAQLGFEASDPPVKPPQTAPVEESIPLTDLSEQSSLSTPHSTPARKAPAQPDRRKDSRQPLPELDLGELGTDLAEAETSRPAGKIRSPRSEERPTQRGPRVRPAVSPAGGTSAGKLFLGFLLLLALSAGGWWMIGQRSANASGQGGGQGAPPTGRLPAHRSAPAPVSATAPSNVGLSSTGSRPGNAAPAPATEPKPPEGSTSPVSTLSPEEMRKEIAGLFATGKAQIQKSDFDEAVATFSKILDLDPANLEAKEQLDKAAGRVQEQKKLEEDLQTGKQFFVEKDFESALRKFYRLPKDRNLGEVDLFIRNAWFNWAVVSLKGGNCVEALQRLEENLTLHPDDQEAAKLREVAEQYRDRPKDKVFYAYVDRLTYRTLNQK